MFVHIQCNEAFLVSSVVVGIITFAVNHVNHLPTCDPTASTEVRAFIQQDQVITLTGSDVDVIDTLGFVIVDVPLNGYGFLYQYIASVNSSRTGNYRGALITPNTVVLDSLGRVLYVNGSVASAGPQTIYGSFDFSIMDGSGVSQVLCTRNIYLDVPIIPQAPMLVRSSTQDADFDITFTPAYSQLDVIQFQSVTIQTMPSQGLLFIKNSDTTYGAKITVAPYTISLPPRPDPSALIALWYSPIIYTYSQQDVPYATFNYSVCATNAACSTSLGTVQLNVLKKDHAPIAYDGKAVGLNTVLPTQINLTATTVDDVNLTATIYAFPQYGHLTRLDGSLLVNSSQVIEEPLAVLYHPNASSNVESIFYDAFYFKAAGAKFSSSAARYQLLIGNDTLMPRAFPQALMILEGAQITIQLSGEDFKDGVVFADVTSQNVSRGGTFSQTNGDVLPIGRVSDRNNNITFQAPSVGFGANFASLTFRVVNDDGLPGLDSTISIDIQHVKYVPVAYDAVVSMSEDSIQIIRLDGAVADVTTLYANITSLPLSGTLYTCTLIPNPIPTVLFNTLYTNLLATAVPQVLPYVGILITSVPFVVSAGCAGDATRAGVVYVPPVHMAGSQALFGVLDTLTYFIEDGVLASPNEALVQIKVLHVQYNPIALNQTAVDANSTMPTQITLTGRPAGAVVTTRVHSTDYVPTLPSITTEENTPVLISLSSYDVDGGIVQAVLQDPPINGVLSVAVSYTDADSDDIEYSMSVASDFIDKSTLAQGISSTGYFMQAPLPGLTSGLPSMATIPTNKAFYTPNIYYSGSDSFTWFSRLISPIDAGLPAAGDSELAFVNIDVWFVQQVPSLPTAPVSVNARLNHACFVPFVGSDPQHQILTYTILSLPSQGTLYQVPSYVINVQAFADGTYKYGVNQTALDEHTMVRRRRLLSTSIVSIPVDTIEIGFPSGTSSKRWVRMSPTQKASSRSFLISTKPDRRNRIISIRSSITLRRMQCSLRRTM